MYRRYLPSLDLKRQQLTAERNKTQARIAEIEAQIARHIEEIGGEIPMLADKNIDLKGLRDPQSGQDSEGRAGKVAQLLNQSIRHPFPLGARSFLSANMLVRRVLLCSCRSPPRPVSSLSRPASALRPRRAFFWHHA